MRRGGKLAVVTMLVVACGGAPQQARVEVGRRSAAPTAAPVVVDDPAHEWHDWTPTKVGPFYAVVWLPMVAPSLAGGGPCTLAHVEGARLLECGQIAVVRGATLDFEALPLPGGGASGITGRFPDDLWAVQSLLMSGDGPAPDPTDSYRDPISEGYAQLLHLAGGRWRPLGTASTERFPYVGGSRAVLRLPAHDALPDPRPKPCSDYSCLRTVPRVITSGATKPDFSALKDRVTWLHVDFSPDFAFAADPEGPVYVVMRALDLRTQKKGFGVAKWTPADGATFAWLPSPLDAAAAPFIRQLSAQKGRARMIFDDNKRRVVVEHDGSTWKSARVLAKGEPESPELPQTEQASPYRQGPGGLVEVLPDGSERAMDGFDDFVSVETVAPGDTWVMTRSGVYRTIRPPETFVRSGPWGPVHAWPPPADDDCAHPFVVLDAVVPAAVEALRKTDWPTESDVPLVSFEVHGLAVVGASVPTMAEAKRLADQLRPNGERGLEGGPHGIVCARPFGARPFALTPVDPRGPAPE